MICSPMEPGLILQHDAVAPPALFGDWCAVRGIPYAVVRVWEDGLPEADAPWICALGSSHAPGESGAPEWVGEEVALLREGLRSGTPILGICFGGQALAAAAGSEIAPAAPPEVGWYEVESFDQRVPAGPWLHFHFDQFSLPDGAEELARSAAGPAAFAIGRSLGVQFHPEATGELGLEWGEQEAERLASEGVATHLRIDPARAELAADAAWSLFDGWWRRAST